MVGTARGRTADRAALLKKLVPALKKHYKFSTPRTDLPVMETMLYAVCLEDASVEHAEKCYRRLFEVFPDLNEARVSSVTELQRLFEGEQDADFRAFRVRAILQHVFDKNYAFEFEGLKKKTLELAIKQLARIKHATTFVRSFTLCVAVGAHQLPLDESSCRVLVWLGISQPGQSAEECAEGLKTSIRKADGPEFCAAIRALATDAKVRAAFGLIKPEDPAGLLCDSASALDRLDDLWKVGGETYKARIAKQLASEAAAAEAALAKTAKATAVKAAAAAKVAAKAAAKSAAAKPAAPKSAVGKSAVKPGKESSGKELSVKEAASKESAKAAAAKEAVSAKEAAAAKEAAKKAAAKKKGTPATPAKGSGDKKEKAATKKK